MKKYAFAAALIGTVATPAFADDVGVGIQGERLSALGVLEAKARRFFTVFDPPVHFVAS
jgi:hypothetical protein